MNTKDFIIFLDIDGVLVHSDYNPSGKVLLEDFDPKCVDKLNQLISALKAKIVISSTWRCFHSINELRVLLNNAGVQSEVIGVTPLINERGGEILYWLYEHNLDINSNYLVIDDNIHDIEPFIPQNKILYIQDGMTNGGLEGLGK